ncbi:MAG TPA: DsbA family protein [Candidatus Binataceae bacterium]|nr:DsbA family protein [Candidatus Binataceae bacterium]
MGFAVLRKLKPEFDFTVRHRGFQIHPEWPAEGMPAEQWKSGMSPQARQALWERLGVMGAAVGVEMKAPRTFANSMLALQASEFAAEAGVAEAFEDRVFRAYFTEGLNIGKRDVLLDLGAEVGLDRAALGEALDSGKYAMRIKNHAQAASQQGISGVPTFLIGDFPLVGAQSEDVMRRVLQRARELIEAAKP